MFAVSWIQNTVLYDLVFHPPPLLQPLPRSSFQLCFHGSHVFTSKPETHMREIDSSVLRQNSQFQFQLQCNAIKMLPPEKATKSDDKLYIVALTSPAFKL